MKISAKKQLPFCEKTTEIYIYFVIIFLSLFCFPNYSYITEGKFNVFFWGTLAFAAVLLLGNLEIIIVGSKTDFKDGIGKLVSIPAISLAAFLLCCVISFLLSSHKDMALIGDGKFDGLISDILYTFVFAAVLCFGRFKLQYIAAFIPVVFINFVLVILQFFGSNPLSLYPKGMTYHDAFVLYANEFFGTLGNVDLLSAFMAMVLPLFIVASIKCEGKKRIPYLISIFPAAFMLFLCKVNAGLIGTASTVMVIAFFVRDQKALKVFSIALSVLFSAASFAMCLLNIISPIYLVIPLILLIASCFIKGFSRKVFLSVFYSLAALCVLIFIFVLFRTNDADSGRFRIWKDAVRIFSEHPVFGSGPDTFIREVSFSFERFSEEHGIMISSDIDSAHNIYLNILACTGITSFAAFAVFIISVLKKSRYSLLFPAIVSFLVQGFFSFEVCSVSAVFYLICGLAVCDKSNIYNKDAEL